MLYLFRKIQVALVFGSVVLSALCPVRSGDKSQSEWQLADVPQVWKDLASRYGAREGFSWFRCAVTVPDAWKGRKLTLFVEAVDDAREVYVNGQLVGELGTMPPEFRSGLGATLRFEVDAKSIQFGEQNVIAMRIYQNQSRTGFNVAAPVLFAADQAIRLNGKWQARIGDDVDWAKLSARGEIDAEAGFAKLENADEVELTLKKLDDEKGLLRVEETLKLIEVADDLQVSAVLTEPEIGQPLSIKFDERGRLWLTEYLQYPHPAGLTMLSRDKFLRAVYDKVPPPPPHHFPGKDRVSIHEDTDGDGKYDSHKVFVDGLSLATSFALGRGGVFVLNPPYLLFYPDKNHDDVPDGDPEVLLEGFGLEDSHSIANSLRWGPDGWLYAAQGSTVSGHVKRYGTDDKPIHSLGQLIWRYHPEKRRYEIFAEGGGNSFGVEIDAKGRIYSGHNGGDTRGFHYVQGGYYQKGFGKHGPLSNPYAFGYFPWMTHAAVPRFTHTFEIYESTELPERYHGKLFGVGPLQGHVVYSQIEREGSSFQTTDLGHPFVSGDTWVRPVDIQTGPDGALYVADLYEQRIDHASHYQGRVHKESGRIYRLSGLNAEQPKPVDLGRLTTQQLIEHLRHHNPWVRETALRLIADRQEEAGCEQLWELLQKSQGQDALELLWALNLSGGLTEQVAVGLLAHKDPYVRLWSVRLLCDEGNLLPETAARISELSARESDIEARSQLACSARRLPANQCLDILRNLIMFHDDQDDIHLPLLVWWGFESKAEPDRDLILNLLAAKNLWARPMFQKQIAARLMRRYAATGKRNDLLTCGKLFELAPTPELARPLMEGFEQAYAGRSLGGVPDELLQQLAKHGGGSLSLRLRQSDVQAIDEALKSILDDKADKQNRLQLVRILGEVKNDRALPAILQLLRESGDKDLQNAALNAAQSFESDAIAELIIGLSSKLSPEVRDVGLAVLGSRQAWTQKLLDAVDAGKIEIDAIPLAVVRKVLLHKDEKIRESIKKYWGDVAGATTEDMLRQMQRMTQVIGVGSGNPYAGKEMFNANCVKCHQLFESGGEIGPDLTSYKRDDLQRMLLNVVNPSIEIREGYESQLVVTDDGRTLAGFIADQDNQVVVLKTAEGQSLIIRRESIDEMEPAKNSIMPEGLLEKYSDQQVRDLFAYLRATQPLP